LKSLEKSKEPNAAGKTKTLEPASANISLDSQESSNMLITKEVVLPQNMHSRSPKENSREESQTDLPESSLDLTVGLWSLASIIAMITVSVTKQFWEVTSDPKILNRVITDNKSDH
jgi:hypothetical protein